MRTLARTVGGALGDMLIGLLIWAVLGIRILEKRPSPLARKETGDDQETTEAKETG